MELDPTIKEKRILTSFKTLEDTFNKVHNNFYLYDKAISQAAKDIGVPASGLFKWVNNNKTYQPKYNIKDIERI